MGDPVNTVSRLRLVVKTDDLDDERGSSDEQPDVNGWKDRRLYSVPDPYFPLTGHSALHACRIRRRAGFSALWSLTSCSQVNLASGDSSQSICKTQELSSCSARKLHRPSSSLVGSSYA